jgi:maleate isomerase
VDLRDQVEFRAPGGQIGIGIVAPFDLALDREYWRWAPDQVWLYVTRTPFVDQPVGVSLAEALSDEAVVAQATRDLRIPDPAVTVYACTSGSFVHGLVGEERLRRAMEAAGARRAITTSGALLEALDALGAHRVGVGTPYDAAATAKLADFLAEAGYEVRTTAYLGLTSDIFRVSNETVRRLATTADDAAADVVFLSCTNLWTFDVLAELEQRLHKPVLSANQVTMWAALRAAGVWPEHVDQHLFQLRPEPTPA